MKDVKKNSRSISLEHSRTLRNVAANLDGKLSLVPFRRTSLRRRHYMYFKEIKVRGVEIFSIPMERHPNIYKTYQAQYCGV